MTIEEKARAYDEALEDMRVIYPNLKGDAKLAVEHAFPQLRESEDEMIRKALIDALKVSETIGELKFRLPYPTREECIAYLEKQKEQKPWKVGANAYFTPEQEPVVTHGETYHVDTLGTQQVIAGKMPQKPAEWSEDDKGILLSVKCVIDEVWHSKNNTTDCPADELEEMWHWLDTLWQRVEYPQPSWKPSEEQMNALNFTITYILSTNANPIVLRDLYNDLLKLK